MPDPTAGFTLKIMDTIFLFRFPIPKRNYSVTIHLELFLQAFPPYLIPAGFTNLLVTFSQFPFPVPNRTKDCNHPRAPLQYLKKTPANILRRRF